MDKSKQIPHQATDREITPIKFWGNISLSVLIILANIVLLRNVLQVPETTVSYVAMVVHVLVIIAGFVVILLTLRGHQKLGAQIAFYTAIVLFGSGAFLYTGRALTASFSLLVVSAIMISQLLPSELKRRSNVTVVAAFLSIWVIEWINPSWRLTSTVSPVGWVSSILFALILAIIVVRRAWGGNFRVKIITAFTVVALTLLAILGPIVYFNYRNQVLQDTRQRMLNIVSLVAMNQDGDLHSTIHGPENAKDEAHINILAQNVSYLATDSDLKYIYTMRKNDQGQIYFVINARQGGEPGDPIGMIYDEPSELLRTQFDSLSGPVVEEDIYTDIYGSVLPAYAPFYRSDGTREGIIGVDLDAAKVFAEERRVLSLILGTTAVTMLIVTLLGFWLGNIFAGPIIKLSNATQKIMAGDLSARAEVETGDEVGALANAFNQMTSQLQATLQGLEQRVAARTRNLVLAAEVGRTVSQVRALNVMLQDACELIRKEFDLYYVQVYLSDPSQTKLALEAGTGEVGVQLVERGHNLPLNADSINGRAAVERRTVVISDTTQSATFRPNPLLPDTRGEMAVPLIVADKVVGVLDMQSNEPGVLTDEILPAFEALAGQLAVAVQNATLLAETEQARAQVEAQARRLVQTGWIEHMDGIHEPEKIGFLFDRNHLTLISETDEIELPEDGKAVSAPIAVTGEPLGSLVVEVENEAQREQASELVSVIARQMAQQVENLRLLESAERYRSEAERIVRLQTFQGWQEYVRSRPGSNLGYLYDLKEVHPYNNGHEQPNALTLPIKARDAKVGQVSVQGLSPEDKQALELTNVVVERLGEHIESLRQYDQTQSALTQSERLFDASRSLTQATDLQELLSATMKTFDISAINRAILTTFAYDSEGELEQLTVVASWWNGKGREATPIGTRYSQEIIQLMPAFVSPNPIFFNDTFTDERVDEKTREFAKRLNLRAVAVLPLHLGSRQIGALFLEAENPYKFTPDEIRLFISLAPQIATVLENRRQYEMAQSQAEREAMLNAINQKIQSATSVEAVLQIAARELGRALDASKAVAQLGVFKKNGSNAKDGNGHQ